MLDTMRDRAIAYSPREAATVEEELVEVTINGETRTLPQSVLEKIENGGKWTAELSHKADGLSAKERALAAKEETLATRETALERRVAEMETMNREPTVAEQKEVVRAAGISLKGLPNPVDDPDAYNTALEERFNQAVQMATDAAVSRARGEFGQRLEASQQQTAATTAQSAAAERVFRDNESTVNAYFDKMKEAGMPLTAADKARVIKLMDTQMRVPEAGFAERDRASGKIRFTEAAVEAADAAVRRKFYAERAKEEGLQEGLRRAGVGDLTPATKAPPKDATVSEKTEYFLTLSEKPPRGGGLSPAERYLQSLPEEEENAIILQMYRDGEAEGADSLLGA